MKKKKKKKRKNIPWFIVYYKLRRVDLCANVYSIRKKDQNAYIYAACKHCVRMKINIYLSQTKRLYKTYSLANLVLSELTQI
jgi:hypothetical protein